MAVLEHRYRILSEPAERRIIFFEAMASPTTNLEGSILDLFPSTGARRRNRPSSVVSKIGTAIPLATRRRTSLKRKVGLTIAKVA